MTVADEWRSIDVFLAAHRVRFGAPTKAQTTGGKHAPTSLHYAGRGRDYGRSTSDMRAILEALRPYATGPDHVLHELYGLTTYLKRGETISPSRALFDAHQNHVHVGLRAGRTLPLPVETHTIEEIRTMVDNPDLPNIEGPLQLAVLTDQAGNCTGYAIFSISTGELHGFGPGWKYFGRSEDLTPD